MNQSLASMEYRAESHVTDRLEARVKELESALEAMLNGVGDYTEIRDAARAALAKKENPNATV